MNHVGKVHPWAHELPSRCRCPKLNRIYIHRWVIRTAGTVLGSWAHYYIHTIIKYEIEYMQTSDAINYLSLKLISDILYTASPRPDSPLTPT